MVSQVSTPLPTGDTIDQAIERSGGPGSKEDKGWEAVIAALDAALVLRTLRGQPDSSPKDAAGLP